MPLPGHSYRHRFKKLDGTLFDVATTADDYRQLGQKNPINPVHLDGTWVASYQFYDIPIGFYAIETPQRVQINFDGRRGTIKAELLGDGNVTPEMTAEVEKQYSLAGAVLLVES